MQTLQRTETLILYLFCQQKHEEPSSKVGYFSKIAKKNPYCQKRLENSHGFLNVSYT